MCLDEGRTREATIVDHIVPLAHHGPDTDDNTRNLCDPHHRLVTIEQFGFAVARSERGVTRDGRPIDREHPWNGTGAGPTSVAAPARSPRRPTPPRGVESQPADLPDTA
ncbi:HNH endonuclease signature motif containing protein [Sphingomonas sp. Leaf37]|uniref:HNH endonuclease signature motif containing protein n=1 Tax=Sphingomonas sp. Leaf37 TaxID=2876552 RepID=UPI001E423F05|nr:HNH endonuclease signature motif containing protein [Sphingomonas sp. Leaf37]